MVITAEQVMQVIKDYFKRYQEETDIDSLSEAKVTSILIQSYEVIELSMEIEDSLGIKEDIIDLAEFAADFASLTFWELAEQIAQRLTEILSKKENGELPSETLNHANRKELKETGM